MYSDNLTYFVMKVSKLLLTGYIHKYSLLKLEYWNKKDNHLKNVYKSTIEN